MTETLEKVIVDERYKAPFSEVYPKPKKIAQDIVRGEYKKEARAVLESVKGLSFVPLSQKDINIATVVLEQKEIDLGKKVVLG